MGWEGTLRSILEIAEVIEEGAAKQQHLQQEKLRFQADVEEKKASLREVQAFLKSVDQTTSLHKECHPKTDWNAIYNKEEPSPPVRQAAWEQAAIEQIKTYRPTTFEKMTGAASRKKIELEMGLEQARMQDESAYQNQYQRYLRAFESWDVARQTAWSMLSGDLTAYQQTIVDRQLKRILLSAEIEIDIRSFDAHCVEIFMKVAGFSIVPTQIKSLTSTSKVAFKKMPPDTGREIYALYVCGGALRVGREFFAALPFEKSLVTVWTRALNTQNGHEEDVAILSILFERHMMGSLFFDSLSPVDAMQNFPHKMDFHLSHGFRPIVPLSFEGAS